MIIDSQLIRAGNVTTGRFSFNPFSDYRMKALFSLVFILLSNLMYSQVSLGINAGAEIRTGLGFQAGLQSEWLVGQVSFTGEGTFQQLYNNQVLAKLDNLEKQYYQFRTSYLGASIGLKYKLELGKLHGYGLIQPIVLWSLGSVAYFRTDETIYDLERVELSALGLRGYDFGMAVGLGVEKSLLDGKKIFTDIRYYTGLINLDISGTVGVFNEKMSLQLGLLVPLGR